MSLCPTAGRLGPICSAARQEEPVEYRILGALDLPNISWHAGIRSRTGQYRAGDRCALCAPPAEMEGANAAGGSALRKDALVSQDCGKPVFGAWLAAAARY